MSSLGWLCHAHCQSSVQSADSFHTPVFADLMQMGPDGCGGIATRAEARTGSVPP